MSLTLNRFSFPFLMPIPSVVARLTQKCSPVRSHCVRTIIRLAGLSYNNQVEREAIQIQGTIYLLMDDHLLYVRGNVFGNAC